MAKSTSRRTGSKKKPARVAPARKFVAPQGCDAGQACRVRQTCRRAGQAREGVGQGQMGLSLRQRQGRGPPRHARPPRRQGRGPRRDGQSRPAGAARLHHHDCGLHAVLRQQQALSRWAARAGRRRAARDRPCHRQGIRRRHKSAPGLGALGRAGVDAGHDGHRAQSRPQRRDGRGAGAQVGRSTLRLQFLSSLHHDVFRRGARLRPPPLRGNPRRPQGQERLHARYRPVGR